MLVPVTRVGGEAARQTFLHANSEFIFRLAGPKELNAKCRPISDGGHSQLSSRQEKPGKGGSLKS